jgi:hypothetical protein
MTGKHDAWIFSLCILLGWVTVLSTNSYAQSSPDLIIVHSFDSTRVETQRFESQFRDALLQQQRLPVSIQVETYYLAANALNAGITQKRLAAQALVQRFLRLQPKLIILVDEPAARLVGTRLHRYTDLVTINVGAGEALTNHTEDEPPNLSNVIFAALPLQSNAQLWSDILSLPAEARGMIILGSDQQVELSTLESDAEGGSIQWELKTVASWSELKSAIRWANYRDDIHLIYPAVKFLPWRGEAWLHRSQMVGWIRENTRKPVIGSTVYSVEQGLTGGLVTDQRLLGEFTGNLAGQILRGEVSPKELSGQTEKSENTMSFNLASIRALGISISPEVLTAAEFVFEQQP